MIKLQLNAEIYPVSVIKRAVKDYASIALIHVKPLKNGYMECSFLHTEYDAELTKKEFCNYLIDCIGSGIDGTD